MSLSVFQSSRQFVVLMGWLWFLLLLQGCSGAPFFRDLLEPEVKVKNVKVMQANLQEALLNVNMMVYNPNSYEIALDEINYRIKLNGRRFSEGVARENLKVGPKATTLIPLPLTVKYSDLLLSLDDIAKGRQLTYDVEGDAKVGLFAIPFSKAGNLDL